MSRRTSSRLATSGATYDGDDIKRTPEYEEFIEKLQAYHDERGYRDFVLTSRWRIVLLHCFVCGRLGSPITDASIQNDIDDCTGDCRAEGQPT